MRKNQNLVEFAKYSSPQADINMNNHSKQLKKLGQDVVEFEKKLTKVIKDNDIRSPSGQKDRKNIAASQGISGKNKSNFNSLKPKVKKHPGSKNQQLASVEVSVKTKCPDKSKKGKSKSSTVVTLPCSASSHKKSESVPHRNLEHCCCISSSKTTKNLIWSNILRDSPSNLPQLIVVESKELEETKTEPTVNHKIVNSNRKNEDEEFSRYHGCPKLGICKTSSISSEDSGAEIVSSGPSCEACFDGKNLRHKKINNCRHGVEFYSGTKPKSQTTLNNAELVHSISRLPLNPMETLQFLMEELHKKVEGNSLSNLLLAEDESTRKLVSEMQLTLEKMSKATTSASEASHRSKLSTRRSSSKRTFGVDNSSKNDLEMQSRVPEQQGSHTIDGKMQFAQPGMQEVIAKRSDSVNKLKENFPEINIDDLSEIQKRTFFSGNKFEVPTKLKSDKDTQISFSLERDEKVKAEIELLKKQLNLQLKSVDSVTAKESEYHSLITSLVDKVKKLEDQVNDQTKVAQNFFAQSNMLLEQNNLIPALQASQDLLSKRLGEALNNYEKLKADYCLLKLEKEKYCALNTVKDKEIKRFKEEIMNVQALVEEQMENLKNFEGLEFASDKVDAIINLIDSQSNMIKSKLGSVKADEASISPASSPSFHSTSSCRSSSPDFLSQKPNSINESGAIAGLSRNNVKDFPTDCYSLNVPELQSPNSS